MRARVCDLERNNAVESDGPVVRLAFVRLDQRDGHVSIRRHRRGERHREARVAGPRLDPTRVENAAAVFDGDQCATLRTFGKLHGCRLTDGVLRFVRSDGEHARGGAGLLALPSCPRRPVHIDSAAGAVAPIQITHTQQVTPPLGLLDLEFPAAHAVDRSDGTFLDDHGARVLNVLRE